MITPCLIIQTETKQSDRCAPAYLSPQAHVKLSSPGAFDGLRIHTDEINEVIGRITPRSLTIAVVRSFNIPLPLLLPALFLC